MIDINKAINKILEYALRNELIHNRDMTYCANRIMNILGIDSFVLENGEDFLEEDVSIILEDFRQWGLENGKVENDSIELLDLFDTEIIAQLIKMPSEIEKKFFDYYSISPEEATKYYYDFAIKSNYIRKDRIEKDIRWKFESEYGEIDLSINMSKPEKDPRLIGMDKSNKNNSYPQCLLCKENEGYSGYIGQPPRGNHRIINLKLNDEDWYLQYSPYVYYNEHAIVLKDEHTPMKITKETFRRLLDFVELFPHYFIGSNADLPIVGGSILSHDHFQGGKYTFAMEIAEEHNHMMISDGIEASTLKWPLSVIRLRGDSISELTDFSFEVFQKWKSYSNKAIDIIAHTGEEEHNTVTPIVRKNNGKYEVDLVLRNNRTTGKRPFGIFHAREEYHHIKKENIGLIEVMGLAVLPSRLKKELLMIEELIINDRISEIKEHSELSKHYNWIRDLFERGNSFIQSIEKEMMDSIGKIFVKILEDCGVFKNDQSGNKAKIEFLNSLKC